MRRPISFLFLRIGFFTGPAPALERSEGPGRPEARPLHHDLMGSVGETVQGTIGEDRVVEERDRFLDGAVARDDGGGVAVPLDENAVEVAGLLGGELPKAENVGDPRPDLFAKTWTR
jgi:hypothetical protein